MKETNYRNPDNGLNIPLQRAFGSNKHFFELLLERPNVLNNFQTLMSSYREGRPELLDIFPAETQVIRGFHAPEHPDGVLFIDIGGGRGHEILEFVRRFPESKGRMILQEVPDIVKQVEKTDRMEVMEYDFFTPQPIKGIQFLLSTRKQNQNWCVQRTPLTNFRKGARAYYFRMIFHDWSDEKCKAILQNTTLAMTPGYSKMIINDIVMPDKGASRFATQSDINMLAMFAAMERSEKQWRELLGSVGLEISTIWRPREGGPESVIEAVLV